MSHIHDTNISNNKKGYDQRLTPLRKLAHAIYRDFLSFKNENFQLICFYLFLRFAQKIDCGYTLEPPRRGGYNEYPQSMFWSKNIRGIYNYLCRMLQIDYSFEENVHHEMHF